MPLALNSVSLVYLSPNTGVRNESINTGGGYYHVNPAVNFAAKWCGNSRA